MPASADSCLTAAACLRPFCRLGGGEALSCNPVPLPAAWCLTSAVALPFADSAWDTSSTLSTCTRLSKLQARCFALGCISVLGDAFCAVPVPNCTHFKTARGHGCIEPS